ncbi:neuropeptide Y receptor type 2-like [Watersipora subatra]|uniref:neuropeptide Y receptor type 2-like n=1 Tax=Watersipora subatra TaxID=2589382 RepID=UPI00355AD50D
MEYAEGNSTISTLSNGSTFLEPAVDNSTTSADILLKKLPIAIPVIFFYIIIWVVGVAGNTMVLYTVARYKSMRTNTNIFIGCLSVSDLMICFSGIPFTPMSALVNKWSFGEALCKIIPFIVNASVMTSSFISVAIAVDRFVIIVYPHTPKMGTTIQTIVIIVITGLAAIFALPTAIYGRVLDENCADFLPSATWEVTYYWLQISLQLIIPGIIITICYTAIYVRLHQRIAKGLLSKNITKIKAEAKRNRKINRMLIAMVVIFIVCWLPLQLFVFIFSDFDDSDINLIYYFLLFHIFAMSSVIYNPFLYGWMNENFKKHFLQTLHCLKKETHDNTQLTNLETAEKTSETDNKNSQESSSFLTTGLKHKGHATDGSDECAELMPSYQAEMESSPE